MSSEAREEMRPPTEGTGGRDHSRDHTLPTVLGLPGEVWHGSCTQLSRLARPLLDVDAVLVTVLEHHRHTLAGADGPVAEPVGANPGPAPPAVCRAARDQQPTVLQGRGIDPWLMASGASPFEDVACAVWPLASGGAAACVFVGRRRRTLGWTGDELGRLSALAGVAADLLHNVYREEASEELGRDVTQLSDPLTGLSDAVRLLLSMVESPDDPRLPRMSDVVRDRLTAVESAAATLEKRLAASTTQLVAVPVEFDLVRAVRTVTASVGASDAAQLRLDLPPGPVWGQDDPERFIQVLARLLDGARQACGPGSWVSVRLDRVGENHRVVLESPCPLPVASLVRVVARAGSSDGGDHPVSVSQAAGVVRVRCHMADGCSAATSSVLTLRVPR